MSMLAIGATILYLFGLLTGLTYGVYLDVTSNWLASRPELQLAVRCGMAGMYGGIVYCLRGVYLNASVRRSWDSAWSSWYIIRPIVSFVVGSASFLFLRAGLFVLNSSPDLAASPVGFFVLAFIAGLNVDRFLARIESVAKATWGIRPSRTSESDSSPEKT